MPKIFLNMQLCFFLFVTGQASEDFDRYMGDTVSYKKYVQTEEDKKSLDFYKQVFQTRQKTFSQMPYVLHLIWLKDHKTFPKDKMQKVAKWQKQHPLWKVKVWTNDKKLSLPKNVSLHSIEDFSFAFLQEYFMDTQNLKEKEKLLAYEILYKEGGVFFSLDLCDLSKYSEEWLRYTFFSIVTPPHDAITNSSIFLLGEIIGSIPSHPLLLRTMSLIQKKWYEISASFVEDDTSSYVYRYLYRTLYPLEEAFKESWNQQTQNIIAFPYFFVFPFKATVPQFFTLWKDQRQTLENRIQQQMDMLKVYVKRCTYFQYGFCSILIFSALALMLKNFLRRKNQAP